MLYITISSTTSPVSDNNPPWNSGMLISFLTLNNLERSVSFFGGNDDELDLFVLGKIFMKMGNDLRVVSEIQ